MKNIGIGSSRRRIRQAPNHLGPDSILNLTAAAIVAQSRPGLKLLLSGGKTAGPDLPSEASAGRDYLMKEFSGIDGNDIITEEESMDTAQNAENCLPLLKRYSHIGLLSVGLHAVNAAVLYVRYGIPVEGVMTSQEIIRRDGHYASLLNEHRSPRTTLEFVKEAARYILLQTIDRRGMLLRQITLRSRG
ncbi:MAG TPA: YdcF family protein [Candidatus Saccharimonadales bacterium]|nr:YdcF family protein [Candidatus Saccharimonadales bacterium]